MANINRDYLVVVNVKRSGVTLDNGSITFNILDKNTSNIFVNLVINTSQNSLIQKYSSIENAEDYTVVMNIVKPNNEFLTLEGKLHNKEEAIYEFNLPAEATDVIGTYRCELLTKCEIEEREEVTTSNELTYSVLKSILNDLGDITTDTETYPVIIELFGKLSDIDRYEEDRRQGEIARQISEKDRAARFDTMTYNMQDEFNDLMGVMTKQVEDIEERYANTDFGIFHSRFEAVEEVNRIQNERLNAKDVADKRQDYNIACLFADSSTQRATIEVEDNDVPLLNSRDGFALVHSMEGKTMVNLNKDVNKALTLNEAINLEGQDIITTQGTDGGLVDVYLEGKTMVNLIDQEEAVPLTKGYTVETGNHVAFQGEYDGKAKPYIYGNTLVNLAEINETNALLHPLEAGTTYTLVFTTTKEPTSSARSCFFFYLDGGTTQYIEPVPNAHYTKLGQHRLVFTANDNYPNMSVWKNDVVGELEYSDIMLLEGDYTNKPIPDYFEGLQSSFEEQLVPTNLVESYEANNFAVLKAELLGDNTFKLQCGISINDSFIKPMGGLHGYKPNTTYTVVVDVLENTCGKLLGISEINAPLAELSASKKYFRNLTGISVLTITTSNDMTVDKNGNAANSDLYFGIWDANTGDDFSKHITFKYYIFEGDLTSFNFSDYDPSKGGKYRVDYVSRGKNLFNIDEVQEGYYVSHDLDNNAFGISSSSTWKITGYIPIKPNTTYVKTGGLSSGAYFDKNKQEIRTAYCPVGATFTTPSRAYYVVLTSKIETDWSQGQIEEGTAKTAYEPFKQTTKTLYLNSPLLEGDSIEVSGNNIYHVHTRDGYASELISSNDDLYIDSYVNGHLDFDSAVPIERVMFDVHYMFLKYLRPNVLYDVQFEADEVGITNVLLGNWHTHKDIVKGVNKFTLTALSENTVFGVDGIGCNISNIVITEATDMDFGYFKGMKSVGECEELEIISSNANNTQSDSQQPTHEPLRSAGDIKDRYVLIDGEWYIERNCGERAYEDGDELDLPTDKVNAVYPLSAPQYEKLDYNPLSVYKGMTHITTNSTIPCNLKVKNHGFNTMLRPNTTYTIASTKGTQTFVTGATLDDSLRLYGEGIMKDVRVFEGAVTDNIPSHFSGIESAFEQTYDEEVGKYKVEITTTGKNLLDVEEWRKRESFDNTFAGNGFYVYKAKVEKGKTYTVSVGFKDKIYFEEYDLYPYLAISSQYAHNRQEAWFNHKTVNCVKEHTITSIDGFLYFYMTTGMDYINYLVDNIVSIQLEEGNEVTTFEPYKSSTISFYLDEPLRGIGDVRDRAFMQDGEIKIERMVGEITLVGNERWILFEYGDTTTPFSLDSTYLNNNYAQTNGKNLLCNNFTSAIKNTTYETELEAVALNSHPMHSLQVRIANMKLSEISEDGFKQWLQKNPTTVTYVLAEPVIEVIGNIGGKLAVEIFENGHLSFNTNVPISSKLEYTVSVPLLEEVAEVTNITDQQDMLIVDMATQLAIMNLTL